MTEPIIYWGIECAICARKIAFGVRLDLRYGYPLTFLKPGTFECIEGHSHAYTIDDLIYFDLNDENVSDTAIQRNREGYRLLNQPGDTYPMPEER